MHGSWRSGCVVLAVTAILGCAPPSVAEDCGFKTPPDISIDKELMITDLSVVNDARAGGPDGAWSFGHLIRAVAHDPETAGNLANTWLASWDEPHIVNGFELAARPSVRAALVQPWRTRDGASAAEGWRPNLANAPFRLLAIVYRPDLGVIGRDGAIASAGEARFVFTAIDLSHSASLDDAPPLPFTVILEYMLPARDRSDVQRWAELWHDLGWRPFGPAYNEALQQITERFAGTTAVRVAPPRLRTNDGLALPWQLREFHFDSERRAFFNAPVSNTPHLSLTGHDAELSAHLNAHPGEDIPERFLGGSAEIPDAGFRWPPMTTANNVVRHGFAMLTCNGCHSAETGRKADSADGHSVPAGFRHLGGRTHDARATLSEFLTGNPAVVPDPTGKLQFFCDLKLRQQALFEALHPPEATSAASPAVDLPVARARRERTD